jgi:hypothetical protein
VANTTDSRSVSVRASQGLVLWMGGGGSLTVLCDARSQAGPVPPIRRRHTPHICSSKEEGIGEKWAGVVMYGKQES